MALSVAACTGTGSAAPSPQASQPAASSAPPEAGVAVAVAPAYSEPVRLVTLGDGYTFGTETTAPRRDSWPAQLVEVMKRGGVRVLLWNLAEQSHTSDLVVEEQLGQVASLEPDVVTLQVGVNDIISRDTAFYRENIDTVLDELLTILPPERIFVITTPDHTLTHWGKAFGPREDSLAAVEELNATLTDAAGERGIGVIDIASVNELAAGDPSLVIAEGPYGTPKQYAGWVEIIGPHIRKAVLATDP